MSDHQSTTTNPESVVRRVDIVAAVRNEENFLPGFIDRVDRLELPSGVELGMVFVEDSSTDGTVALLRRYASEHKRISYYCLKRGYGQCAAIALGLKMSSADAVIMMDADGEHTPEIIPEILGHYLAGADIVQCVRRSRSIPQAYRRIGSALFNKVARLITGVNLKDQNVYYRLVTAERLARLIVDNKWLHFLRLSGAQLRGATIKHVYFEVSTSDERQSTYGLRRLVGFAFDALLSLVSRERFVVLLAIVLVLSMVLVLGGLAPIGIIVIVLAALVLRKHIAMARNDVLGRLEVIEKGPKSEGKQEP